MKTIALQSGSNGNCIYVEADGVRLKVEALDGLRIARVSLLKNEGRKADGGGQKAEG